MEYTIMTITSGNYVYQYFGLWNKPKMRLENAFNIRKWGTTKGLGQLAFEGVRKETILDAVGTIDIVQDKIVFSFALTPVALNSFLEHSDKTFPR